MTCKQINLNKTGFPLTNTYQCSKTGYYVTKNCHICENKENMCVSA